MTGRQAMGLAARRALSVALAMLFGMVALAAVPTPASAAQTCGGVWVVVDYGSLGGTTVSCAASGYGTGTAALRSAGFTPTLDGGFTTKINGKPTTPDTYKEYWSYWHASTNANGTWGAWQYSTLGANSYRPQQGDAEGWRYQSATAGTVSPGTQPPVAPVASPSAIQTKTTAPPAPTTTEPTTAAGSASGSSTSRSGVPASRAGAAPGSSASASADPGSTEPVSATASADASTVPSSGAPSAPSANSSATDTAADAGGTPGPAGAIAAAGLVVVGGAGMGAWWWLKGRSR